MSTKKTYLFVLLITVACMTVLVSSAVLEEKYGVTGGQQMSAGPKCPKNLCKMCQRSIDRIKASGEVTVWKLRLEMLCQFVGDETKVRDCRKMVDKYLDDLNQKSSLEFCQEMKMCPTPPPPPPPTATGAN